jgi:hypothetical protein
MNIKRMISYLAKFPGDMPLVEDEDFFEGEGDFVALNTAFAAASSIAWPDPDENEDFDAYASGLQWALEEVDEHGFGDNVDADWAIEDAAKRYLDFYTIPDHEPWCNHDEPALRDLLVSKCECGSIIHEGEVILKGPAPLSVEPVESDLYGHCDTCGAACDDVGCTEDRSHAAALDGDERSCDTCGKIELNDASGNSPFDWVNGSCEVCDSKILLDETNVERVSEDGAFSIDVEYPLVLTLDFEADEDRSLEAVAKKFVERLDDWIGHGVKVNTEALTFTDLRSFS